MTAGRPRETWNPKSPHYNGGAKPGVAAYSGYLYSKNFVGPRKPRFKLLADDARAQIMVKMFLSGQTMSKIGQMYGLTRERVRQILKKRADITACNGGAKVRVAARLEKRRAALEENCMKRWGIHLAEYKQIAATYGAHGSGARNPFARYIRQRENSNKRGVQFLMTFAEWWEIWQQSGKWGEICQGGACMARFNDAGPYQIGNVYITTGQINGLHMQEKRHGKPLSRLDEVFIPMKKIFRDSRGVIQQVTGVIGAS